MSDLVEMQADERPCPVCGAMTEPELDGDHRYYECEDDDCEAGGYTWGYERVAEGVRIDGSCQLGIPEGIRREASGPMEKAISADGAPVIAGLTLSVRKAD